jgi:dihydroneopterin aldolase
MVGQRIHRAELTPREALLFEAGIKLGGVFHQYLGMPVSNRTAPELAHTIEQSVGLQPFVAGVRVRIDPTRGGPLGTGRFGYHYLTAEMLDVRVRLVDDPIEVEVHLAYRKDLHYPLMSVVRVRATQPEPRRPPRGRP